MKAGPETPTAICLSRSRPVRYGSGVSASEPWTPVNQQGAVRSQPVPHPSTTGPAFQPSPNAWRDKRDTTCRISGSDRTPCKIYTASLSQHRLPVVAVSVIRMSSSRSLLRQPSPTGPPRSRQPAFHPPPSTSVCAPPWPPFWCAGGVATRGMAVKAGAGAWAVPLRQQHV
jgi:hypothetical protein